jgi:hypothetical protein
VVQRFIWGSCAVQRQFIGVENYACSWAVQRFIRDSYALQRWFKGNITHPFALNGYKNPSFTRHGFSCCPALPGTITKN